MESLEALESLSIINKVATELKNHGYGETDADARLVSEFIIGLVNEVPNIEKFAKILRNQANIDTVFSKNVYNLIVNMKKFAGRDKQAKKEAEEMETRNKDIPSGSYNPNQAKIDERKKMFPGLAQKDDAEKARRLLSDDIDPSLSIPEDKKRKKSKSDSKKPKSDKNSKKARNNSGEVDADDLMAQLEKMQDTGKSENKEHERLKKERNRKKE